MFVRRLTTSLKEQHWMTIAIELIIVILGVFIGNWVNDWNQERSEERDSKTLVLRLRPQLERLTDVEQGERTYYAITQRYAETALAGWSGDPKVSDADFVIAAYQASQVAGLSIDGSSLSIALGADSVHKINDPALRAAVISLLSYNFAALRGDALLDDYRTHVREVLPYPVQKRIRQNCGDRQNQDFLILPPRCAIEFAPGEAARAAALLRSHKELAGELSFHVAQTLSWLSNLERLDARVGPLLTLIQKNSQGGSK